MGDAFHRKYEGKDIRDQCRASYDHTSKPRWKGLLLAGYISCRNPKVICSI